MFHLDNPAYGALLTAIAVIVLWLPILLFYRHIRPGKQVPPWAVLSPFVLWGFKADGFIGVISAAALIILIEKLFLTGSIEERAKTSSPAAQAPPSPPAVQEKPASPSKPDPPVPAISDSEKIFLNNLMYVMGYEPNSTPDLPNDVGESYKYIKERLVGSTIADSAALKAHLDFISRRDEKTTETFFQRILSLFDQEKYSAAPKADGIDLEEFVPEMVSEEEKPDLPENWEQKFEKESADKIEMLRRLLDSQREFKAAEERRIQLEEENKKFVSLLKQMSGLEGEAVRREAVLSWIVEVKSMEEARQAEEHAEMLEQMGIAKDDL